MSPNRKGFFKNLLPSHLSELLTETVIAAVQSLPRSPRNDWLRHNFLSKFYGDTTDPANVRRVRAVNKWLACERDNYATNERLLTVLPDYHILPGIEFNVFIDRVRSIIASCVGDTIPFDYLHGGFSGGATTSKRRGMSHPARKFLGKQHVTPDASDIALEAVSDSPIWQSFWGDTQSVLLEHPGNVLFTVPKNTSIDRCACKEPDLNMYLQRGVGNYFRDCLRRVGIDLNDQSRNRRWAWRGSLPSSHPLAVSVATVDLSAASDSVTVTLVDLVMPECISSVLMALRSPVTDVDGTLHVNEMISSMGNGYTFELESLIFWAVAKAVCYFGGYRGPISVYGDDIIIPTDAFHDLERVLEFLGFAVNPEKSFYDGAFRESCGGHYYLGSDVTPFYLRAPLKTITDVIRLANQVRLWSVRGDPAYRLSDPANPLNEEAGTLVCPLEELWMFLSSFVPRKLWGGWDYGSIYRLVSFSRGGYTLVPCSKARRLPDDGAYLSKIHSIRDRTSPPASQTGDGSVELIESTLLRVRRVKDPWLPTALAYSSEWLAHEENNE